MSLKITDWAIEDRPREKLIQKGTASLSDAELLAILISTGTKGLSALDLAKILLESNERKLRNLTNYDYSEFKRIKGIGPAKAVTLSAAFELARRVNDEPIESKRKIQKPDDIAVSYISKFRDKKSETFKVLLLNTSNQIFREITVSEGILNSTPVHPREVFKYAITESAHAIILIHNHPSGQLEPSKEDINITKQLVSVGNLVDIKVLDHLIIAGDSYYSFARHGLL